MKTFDGTLQKLVSRRPNVEQALRDQKRAMHLKSEANWLESHATFKASSCLVKTFPSESLKPYRGFGS